MHGVKVTITNNAALTVAIAAVQSTRMTRHRLDWSDIAVAADDAEARLVAAGIPKYLRPGTVANINPHGPSQKKWGELATVATIERTRTGWVLTDVERGGTHGWARPGDYLTVSIPAEAVSTDRLLRHQGLRIKQAPTHVDGWICRSCGDEGTGDGSAHDPVHNIVAMLMPTAA